MSTRTPPCPLQPPIGTAPGGGGLDSPPSLSHARCPIRCIALTPPLPPPQPRGLLRLCWPGVRQHFSQGVGRPRGGGGHHPGWLLQGDGHFPLHKLRAHLALPQRLRLCRLHTGRAGQGGLFFLLFLGPRWPFLDFIFGAKVAFGLFCFWAKAVVSLRRRARWAPLVVQPHNHTHRQRGGRGG